MTKFNLITLKNNKNLLINEITNNFGLIYDELTFDYLFVFGGDGTFIEQIKKYINDDIKIILINDGKLGFLASINTLNEFNINSNNYSTFFYLLISIDNTAFTCINETIISFDMLTNINLFINNNFIKTIFSSRIYLLNGIGSTGLARSYRYPIMNFCNNNYLIDFLEEPLYNYYVPLFQPLLLNHNHIIDLKFNTFINLSIKIDNIIYTNNISYFRFELKESKLKIYKYNDINEFSNKINTLF